MEKKEKRTKLEEEILDNVKKGIHYKKAGEIKDEALRGQAMKAMEACVHLVQDEFGSGCCITEKGMILTCAHCVEEKKEMEIIFPNGEQSKCMVKFLDLSLDCAILLIEKPVRVYPFLKIASMQPIKGEKLFCIGQPGYFDLESEVEEERTDFYPFYVSEGKVEGYLKDQINGNKKRGLGPLKHSCWTYWGHSGAPIMNTAGELIGLHNSWDDTNGMRHGCSLSTLQQFFKSKKIFF